jgi:hypothetical protein
MDQTYEACRILQFRDENLVNIYIEYEYIYVLCRQARLRNDYDS